jgi:hypothetical protein
VPALKTFASAVSPRSDNGDDSKGCHQQIMLGKVRKYITQNAIQRNGGSALKNDSKMMLSARDFKIPFLS